MKKVALSLLALAVVGVSAFAEAPKWDPKVTTGLKGEAGVTFGYDIDTSVVAMSNYSKASLIVDLVSSGDAATASDKDVWGEIKVVTDGDPVRIKADGVNGNDTVTTAYDNGFKLKVDHAQINFGKNAYMSVTSNDTTMKYGYAPDAAFRAGKRSGLYGSTFAFLTPELGAKGPAAAGGFEVGVTLPSIAKVTVDLSNETAWASAGPNVSQPNLGYKGELSVLAVENLDLKAAYAASTKAKTDIALGGMAAYTVKLGDKPYVKPMVGVTMVQSLGTGDYLPQYSAGVVYALDGKSATFDNYGMKLDKDWGGYPGVALGLISQDKKLAGKTKDVLWLGVSGNSGAVVANTAVVGAFEIADLNGKDNNGNGLDSIVTVGFTNDLKNGDIDLSSKGTLNFEADGTAATSVNRIFAKLSADITGVFPYVTFSPNWESNDLGDSAGANAKSGQSKGKFEFTVKVSF